MAQSWSVMGPRLRLRCHSHGAVYVGLRSQRLHGCIHQARLSFGRAGLLRGARIRMMGYGALGLGPSRSALRVGLSFPEVTRVHASSRHATFSAQPSPSAQLEGRTVMSSGLR
jgi:hypothetical protein